uniref:Uncharacterized protein n=1 Tax=Arundo donax TaxID=35708 RepID=A0A0A9DD72_ARUDO
MSLGRGKNMRKVYSRTRNWKSVSFCRKEIRTSIHCNRYIEGLHAQ